MFHQLLDFGDGRKLEQFGDVMIDRPSRAATGRRELPLSQWQQAAYRFAEDKWQVKKNAPERWRASTSQATFELRPTPAGQVGVFPEQADNWQWLAQRVHDRSRVLNLFAYTGGSTLALAAAGAEVVHVDAAQNVVNWARGNARLSGLEQRPIRWICEDAQKFIRRELKRRNEYEAVVLDPPSYGHGPRKQPWIIEEHLPSLVSNCSQLLSDSWQFVLLSCHTPQFSVRRLRRLLQDALSSVGKIELEVREMVLTTKNGRKLAQGIAVRCVHV